MFFRSLLDETIATVVQPSEKVPLFSKPIVISPPSQPTEDPFINQAKNLIKANNMPVLCKIIKTKLEIELAKNPMDNQEIDKITMIIQEVKENHKLYGWSVYGTPPSIRTLLQIEQQMIDIRAQHVNAKQNLQAT